jgi:hypothetical protein
VLSPYTDVYIPIVFYLKKTDQTSVPEYREMASLVAVPSEIKTDVAELLSTEAPLRSRLSAEIKNYLISVELFAKPRWSGPALNQAQVPHFVCPTTVFRQKFLMSSTRKRVTGSLYCGKGRIVEGNGILLASPSSSFPLLHRTPCDALRTAPLRRSDLGRTLMKR